MWRHLDGDRVAKRHSTRHSWPRARPDAFDDDHRAADGGESEMGTPGVAEVDDDGEKGDGDDESDDESDDDLPPLIQNRNRRVVQTYDESSSEEDGD